MPSLFAPHRVRNFCGPVIGALGALHVCRLRAGVFLALEALALVLASCTTFEFEGWLNKPVPIGLTEDIPLVQLRFNDGKSVIAAVDTGTPFTAVDMARSQLDGSIVVPTLPFLSTTTPRQNGQQTLRVSFSGDLSRNPTRTRGDLRLQDGLFPEVTRFIFRDLEVFDLQIAPLGLDSAVPVRATLGFSVLSHFAVHLSYGAAPSLTLKDEIPDTNQDLASDCNPAALLSPGGTADSSCLAVVRGTPLGGGLAQIGDDLIDLPPTRLLLSVCLLPASFDPTQQSAAGTETATGVPAVALLATGLGTSVISRSAVNRLRAAGHVVEESPGAILYLPYGQEPGRRITLERVAAVSDETADLGPCGELARRRRILVAGTAGLLPEDRDQNGASVALVQNAATFVVLDDVRPLLRGIRQEVAPYVPDVDLVLGGSFLKHFEVDVDYPGARVVLQCAGGGTPGACQVLPFCSANEAPRCPQPTAR
jgi:hypothetical protein